MYILYFIRIMGIDTRFWGPSGWQLFHLIAFKSPHPDDTLNMMKDVLPCKFCRASTTEYVHKHPLRGNPGKWLFEIHNMVNHKLRTQCKDEPSIVDPGPDPPFEEVKARYDNMSRPTAVPGGDFLLSIAANYPEKPEPAEMAVQRRFIHALGESYPFDELRAIVKKHEEPKLESRKVYMKWMHSLIQDLAKKAGTPVPSYKGYAQRIAYYRSGCSKKTYRGKTCRKTSGGRTKDRDHRTTYRVSHERLL
jgi:hypothetical protein